MADVESMYGYIPMGVQPMMAWLRGREINLHEYEEIIRREGARLTDAERGYLQSRLRLSPGDWSNRPPANRVVSSSRIGPQRIGELGAETPKPDREELGRQVREIWIKYAIEMNDMDPRHIASWDQMDEEGKEVDRKIGEQLWARGYAAATHSHEVRLVRAGMTQAKPFALEKVMTVEVEAGHSATLEINGQPIRFSARQPTIHPEASDEVRAIMGRTTDAMADLFIRNLVAIRKDDLRRLVDLTVEAGWLREAVGRYARAMANGSNVACAKAFDAMMRAADRDYDEDAQINPVERRDFDTQLLRIAELVALDDPAEITDEPLTDAIIRQLEEYGRSPALGMVLEQLRAVRRWSTEWPFAYPETGKQAPDGSIGSIADLYNRFWTWAEGFDMILEPNLERLMRLSGQAGAEDTEPDGSDLARIMELLGMEDTQVAGATGAIVQHLEQRRNQPPWAGEEVCGRCAAALRAHFEHENVELLERAYISLEGAKGIGEALDGAWDDSLSMEAWQAWARGYEELAPLIRAAIGKEETHEEGRSPGGGRTEERDQHPPDGQGEGEPALAGTGQGDQPERHDGDADQRGGNQGAAGSPTR